MSSAPATLGHFGTRAEASGVEPSEAEERVADSVNPLGITRDAWRRVARAGSGGYLEVEVVCSDRAEHERRASARTSDIPGFPLPTWQDIISREYEPWDRGHVVVDTATATEAGCVSRLRSALDRRAR